MYIYVCMCARVCVPKHLLMQECVCVCLSICCVCVCLFDCYGGTVSFTSQCVASCPVILELDLDMYIAGANQWL